MSPPSGSRQYSASQPHDPQVSRLKEKIKKLEDEIERLEEKNCGLEGRVSNLESQAQTIDARSAEKALNLLRELKEYSTVVIEEVMQLLKPCGDNLQNLADGPPKIETAQDLTMENAKDERDGKEDVLRSSDGDESVIA